MLENLITTNFIYLTSSNFVTISHINYRDQVNSWKNFWKFWNGSLCRTKSDPSSLLNVAIYWHSSNTENNFEWREEDWSQKLFEVLEVGWFFSYKQLLIIIWLNSDHLLNLFKLICWSYITNPCLRKIWLYVISKQC